MVLLMDEAFPELDFRGEGTAAGACLGDEAGEDAGADFCEIFGGDGSAVLEVVILHVFEFLSDHAFFDARGGFAGEGGDWEGFAGAVGEEVVVDGTAVGIAVHGEVGERVIFADGEAEGGDEGHEACGEEVGPKVAAGSGRRRRGERHPWDVGGAGGERQGETGVREGEEKEGAE